MPFSWNKIEVGTSSCFSVDPFYLHVGRYLTRLIIVSPCQCEVTMENKSCRLEPVMWASIIKTKNIPPLPFYYRTSKDMAQIHRPKFSKH